MTQLIISNTHAQAIKVLNVVTAHFRIIQLETAAIVQRHKLTLLGAGDPLISLD
jgi:hypothetical protein